MRWPWRRAPASGRRPRDRPFPTRDGTWVRSLGEQRIADFLSRRGLAYAYEPEVVGKRPDFLLPEHRIIIEYFGGLEWSRYTAKAAAKVDLFEREGYTVVPIVPLNLRDLEAELEQRLRALDVL